MTSRIKQLDNFQERLMKLEKKDLVRLIMDYEMDTASELPSSLESLMEYFDEWKEMYGKV